MEEKLKKMEELDARIEKINYDLIGLENRKKEMEDDKLNKQKEIDKLEQEKNSILGKTDSMKNFRKFIYITFSLRTDLKRIELINSKVTEFQKEKSNIQNKIDIQNGLYADTIKEKDNYIEQRRQLYIAKTATKEIARENEKVSQIKALTQIYEITSKFRNSKSMKDLSELVEKQINEYMNTNDNNREKMKTKEAEEQME